MKKTLIISMKTILLVSILFIARGCNFGAKENETDNTAFDQETFNALVEGVFEYVAPIRGYAIMVNGYYAFAFGASDTTMASHAGTYEITGDTITTTVLYATNPDMPGYSFKWTAKDLEGDSIQITTFDDEGNAKNTIKTIRLAGASKENTSSYEAYEGVFQYTDPLQGLSFDFEGYFVYLGGTTDTTMDFNSGTYAVDNDTVTSSIEYALNPERNGTAIRWMPGQGEGDTLLYHVLNDDSEVISSGKNLRMK